MDPEEHMAISEALLPEFDHEVANTRKCLERVPDDRLAWKPHEKSMTLGRLAQHLSQLPGWGVQTIVKDCVDIAPPGAPPYQPPPVNSSRELLEEFDKNTANARAAIAGADDEHLKQPWTLQAAGKTIFTLPRMAVIRNMVLNHMIHHRAQLGVYLRMNNIPVPAIYGPSADEASM